jgi:hypothetical protein
MVWWRRSTGGMTLVKNREGGIEARKKMSGRVGRLGELGMTIESSLGCLLCAAGWSCANARLLAFNGGAEAVWPLVSVVVLMVLERHSS